MAKVSGLTSEQRVAIGRSVTAEDDAVDADRADRQHVKDGDVHVGDVEVDLLAEEVDVGLRVEPGPLGGANDMILGDSQHAP